MWAEFITLLLIGWVFAIVMMAVIWWISYRIQNAGIVDIAWSFGFAPLAVFYAAVGNGFLTRRWFMAAMVVLWSVRLGLHLLIRVKSHHPVEDRRYHALRTEWGANVERRMFGFFQVQALLLVALSVPFLITSLNARDGLSPLEFVGVGIWLLALAGESISDQQLKAFKAGVANRGKVCQSGLWHYSRHPNYFFEWLVWVAFFVFALGSPWGWVSIYCPALMLFFLLKVTGIPMTEELSVKNRGDEYRRYQKTTSAFVPWFRRKET